MGRITGRFLVALIAGTAAMARADEPKVPVFTDVTEQAKIGFKLSFGDQELSNIVEGTGTGAMFLDYDNDGYLDIYVVNGRYNATVSDNTGRRLRGKLSNKLFHNNHDGTFTDVTAKAGVSGGESYGVGCSAADYDGDGFVDIYLLNYGPNILYHNNGDGTFTDVTAKSGLAGKPPGKFPQWSVSATWFDYDGDGKLDVFVATYLDFDPNFRNFFAAAGYPGPLSYHGQPDVLYHNNGDGTFTDVTNEAGVFNPEGRGMSASAADVFNTGRLDVFVSNDAMESYLFRNQGKGKFLDDALSCNVAFGENGQGVSAMGPVFGDIDRDGRMDLYVPDMRYGCLHMNRGDGYDVEPVAWGDGTKVPAQGKNVILVGTDTSDLLHVRVFDADGKRITDMDETKFTTALVGGVSVLKQRLPALLPPHVVTEPEKEQVSCEVAAILGQPRNVYFEDATNSSGLALMTGQYIKWGAVLQDFDNDGYLDLFITNGDAHHEYAQEAVMAHNDHKGHFLDVAKRSGPYFEKKQVGRGAAWGDFDNDGDLDLLVVHLNDSPHLVRNDGGNTLNNWLTVIAKLPNGKTDAIGARVTVTTGSLVQIEDLMPMRGYLSQGDPRPHFGLGTAKKADKVEVRWPDGKKTILTDVPANQFLRVVEEAK